MNLRRKLFDGISPQKLGSHVGLFYLHRLIALGFPLILLPLLAHRLLSEAMGHFFVLQAWGLTLSYIIDFGLVAHGTRMIAKLNPDEQGHEIGKIISAQLLLLIIITPLWLVLANFLPVIRSNMNGSVMALLLGAATAITPNWYFLGNQRLKFFVILDMILRIIALIAINCMPYDTTDFISPYSYIVIAQVLICLLAMALMRSRQSFRLMRVRDSLRTLGNNWRLCISEIGLLIPISLNTILLSFFAAPLLIAAYGIAEKIIRGCAALMMALAQSLYPHFTKLQQSGALSIRQLLTWAIGSNGMLTLAATMGIALLAPVVIPFLARDNPDIALNLTYWQIPVLFLFGLQSTIYMHGILARHDDALALRSTIGGVIAYIIVGFMAYYLQSIYIVITAQAISLIVMTLLSFSAQKKTPA